MNGQTCYRRLLIVVAFVFLGGTERVEAQTQYWFVDASASPCDPQQDPECGTTWAKAFPSLQQALAAATANQTPPDQVWVAGGTYQPGTGASDSFQLKNRVEVYGGFAGDENPATFDLADRDFVLNESILSGDLGGGMRSDVILGAVAVDELTILDGFTLTGATQHAISIANASPWLENLLISGNTDDFGYGGAGMVCGGNQARPVLTNCTFESNTSEADGGAVYNHSQSTPEFWSCQFIGNTVQSAGRGGAMSNFFGAAPFIKETEFSGNQAGGYGDGGAIYHFSAAPMTVRECDFIGNQTTDPNTSQGGAILFASSSESAVFNCTFTDNSAGFGGGAIQAQSSQEIVNCKFIGNTANQGGAAYLTSGDTQFVNCVFSGNHALAGSGGGLLTTGSGFPEIVNCSFSANTATTGAGGIHRISGDPLIRNCILWGNASGGVIDEAAQLDGVGEVFFITHSCIQGLNAFASGEGNIGLAPIFVDAVNNDLSLDAESPCIDMGRSVDVPADELDVDDDQDQGEATPDVALAVRLQNALAVAGPTGCGDQTVDMGAYEFSVDCDQNGTPDVEEIELNPSLDLNGDNILDACQDCNSNQVPDPEEIAADPDLDCNGNCILDQCDIADETSNDVNSDGIPDECQDCNTNGIVDPCDLDCGAPSGPCDVLDCGTESDCNGNGLPDDCDRDCDNSGTPDECEFDDCNENCIPDECDLDCGTPGGDCDVPGCGVSEDCNQNGIPDDCEFARPATWTSSSDFNSGTLINLNVDTPDQLRRNAVEDTAPLPFIWVANSVRGTMVRIKTDFTDPADAVVGEYHTGPERHVTNGSPNLYDKNPSRTTVDLDGSAWAANRLDDFRGTGSVVKVGLVTGGTRVDASWTPDANGGYWAPPFDYCTCKDRDGDGLIRTSMGLGDILDWENTDGLDDDGGIENAEDECILLHVRVAGTGVRTIAVDENNDVWTGGYVNHIHEKLDGFTGIPIANTQFNNDNLGGYGGLVDCQGFLWSASSAGDLLRVDTSNVSSFMRIVPHEDRASYGLGLDSDGNIWMTNCALGDWDTVERISPDGVPEAWFDTGGDSFGRGVAVSPRDNDVWVANSGNDAGNDVSRLKAPNYTSRDIITVGPAGASPTGVAIDAAGMVWVTNRGIDNIVRIDPTYETEPLTIDLGEDAYPYNYSDMTGMVSLMASGTGTWSVVHDGGQLAGGTEWGRVDWNQEGICQPPSAEGIEVSVRAADLEAALPLQPYVAIQESGDALDGIVGRFVQIRARLRGTCPGVTPFETPVLGDLSVYAILPQAVGEDCNSNGAPDECDLAEGSSEDCNSNGVLDECDIASGTSQDCQPNGIPDECDIAPLMGADCNSNGVPDECEELQIIYVDPAASEPEDGSTWEAAYANIQTALAQAEFELCAVDEIQIWVAADVYTPDAVQREVSFELVSNVGLYGGFLGNADPGGGETSLDQRNPAANVTVLSGDLNSDDSSGGNSENSYHVVTAFMVSSTAILDGFTISGGNADHASDPAHRDGAGLVNDLGDPTVANCTFSGNYAIGHGGAAFCGFGSLSFVNCRFEGNEAVSRGGGIYSGGTDPQVINCTFTGNTASYGGGIECAGSQLKATNCTFTGNTATIGGRGINAGYSGVEITNCILWDNAVGSPIGGSPTVTYSCVEWDWDGEGNTDLNPSFVGAGNLRLSDVSPCIDAADNTAVPADVADLDGDDDTAEQTPLDLDMHARFVDDPETDDCPLGDCGNPPIVDMGAYEFIPTVVRVDPDATGGANDGMSWQNALTDLQSAWDVEFLQAGSFTEVWIAEGTYMPDGGQVSGAGFTQGTGDRSATFGMIGGVTIKGGYAGESDPGAEPDPTLYVTILSGDLDNDDGPGGDNSENSYHVVSALGTSPVATLEGFTVTRGNANPGEGAEWTGYGGGMLIASTAPEAVMVRNCRFVENAADFGGGLASAYGSAPILIDCAFIENAATAGPTGWGGGVHNTNSNTTLVNCYFIGNTATHWGGGIQNTLSSPTLTNCLFTGNTVTASLSDGGAIYNMLGSHPSLTNCTVVANEAYQDGGGMYNDGSMPTVTSCIFWGNTVAAGEPSAQIYDNPTGLTTVTYSCVQWGWAGPGGAGNTDANPEFVSLPDDLRLKAISPCLDAGDNTAVPADVADLDGDGDLDERTPLDLDRVARFVDDPDTTPDPGVPDPPDYPDVVDMGAYEYQVPEPIRHGSKMDHGTSGDFLIESEDVECRDIQGTIVTLFEFDEAVYSDDGDAFAAGDFTILNGDFVSVEQSPDLMTIDVTCNNVADEVCFSVSFTVENALGYENDLEYVWPILAGDVTNDGYVDSTDTSEVNREDGNPVDENNFRCDVNFDGQIKGSGTSPYDDWQIVEDAQDNGILPCWPVLESQVSFKDHGGARFDIPAGKTEPRAGDLKLLFTFDREVRSLDDDPPVPGDFTVSSGTVYAVRPGWAWSVIEVSVSGHTDEELFVISFDVEDFNDFPIAVEACWPILIGDVDDDGSVTVADANAITAEHGERVTSLNFRHDLDNDGSIEGQGLDTEDLDIAQLNEGHTVAACPQ